MIEYNFGECFRFSNDSERVKIALDFIRREIPGVAKIERASENMDRIGADYLVYTDKREYPICIDFKHSRYCPIERFGKDTLFIETCSVYTGPSGPPWLDEYRIKPGWTLDRSKLTDIVVYTWPQQDGGYRWWSCPFTLLNRVSTSRWREWALKFKEVGVKNRNWYTLGIFIPRKDLEISLLLGRNFYTTARKIKRGIAYI